MSSNRKHLGRKQPWWLWGHLFSLFPPHFLSQPPVPAALSLSLLGRICSDSSTECWPAYLGGLWAGGVCCQAQVPLLYTSNLCHQRLGARDGVDAPCPSQSLSSSAQSCGAGSWWELAVRNLPPPGGPFTRQMQALIMCTASHLSRASVCSLHTPVSSLPMVWPTVYSYFAVNIWTWPAPGTAKKAGNFSKTI